MNDLLTLKLSNKTDQAEGSCFNSTKDYEFDSTGNNIYIKKRALKYYNNTMFVFMIQTFHYKIRDQSINVIIDPSLLQRPTLSFG